MKNPIKVCVPVLAGFITSVLLVGCAAGGGSSNSLSGKVIDMASGQPVAGATVQFASYTATSGTDGSFTMSYSSSSGTETGVFLLSKPGYGGEYIEGASCDRSKNTSIIAGMNPLDSSGYATHTINVRIYDGVPAEIAPTTPVSFYVLTKSGGRYTKQFSYSSPYVINTPAFGTDCLVVATVSPGTTNAFTVVVNNLDLTGGPTNLNLYQDAAHTTAIPVTATTSGSYTGQLSLLSPYGYIPVWAYVFASSASTTANICNPYGYQGFWVQQFDGSNTPAPGYTKSWYSCGNLVAVSGSVALPSLDMSLGPTWYSDPSSYSYAIASGTLSASAAAGAVMYQYMLSENVSPPSSAAWVMSSSPTIVLPSAIRNALSGKNVRVSLYVIDASSVYVQNIDVEAICKSMGSNGLSPSAQWASISCGSTVLPF